MVKVIFSENSIKVKGHSNNEVCSRVSTIFQMTSKYFSEKTKILKIVSGESYLLVDNLSEQEQKYFNFMTDGFKDLKKLYPNTIKVEELKNEKN